MEKTTNEQCSFFSIMVIYCEYTLRGWHNCLEVEGNQGVFDSPSDSSARKTLLCDRNPSPLGNSGS
jgi:hypothetical protein